MNKTDNQSQDSLGPRTAGGSVPRPCSGLRYETWNWLSGPFLWFMWGWIAAAAIIIPAMGICMRIKSQESKQQSTEQQDQRQSGKSQSVREPDASGAAKTNEESNEWRGEHPDVTVMSEGHLWGGWLKTVLPMVILVACWGGWLAWLRRGEKRGWRNLSELCGPPTQAGQNDSTEAPPR